MILSEIGKLIKEKDRFAIVSHISPDGDALGSSLGLYNALKEVGKSADFYINDNLPHKYSYLPGFSESKKLEEFSEKDRYECLFVLDCSDMDRFRELNSLISKADVIINIDHHISNTLFGDINFVDSNASSVGEIIYQLLKINGFTISNQTAECLYTSILTDTGGFKYSNTTSITFSIVGDLINTGIDFSDIYNRVFDVKTYEKVKLLSSVTSSLEMAFNGRVAILTLTQKMLEENNAKEEDSDEFVNIARDIEGTEVGIFIKERDKNSCKVSLRSKKYIDVRKIAEIFGGGGHIRAAGCTINKNTFEAKKMIVDVLKEHMGVTH